VATGAAVGEFAAEADAVMFCLSKGLGAPIGSVLCGAADFMDEARRTRILFGGAWRQAGVMAAAGLVALDEGPELLAADHANARTLAEGLAEVTPAALEPDSVETNIVFADVAALGWRPFDVLDRLREAGVLANVVAGRIRFLTHRDVTRGDMDETVAVWRRLAKDLGDGEGRE
jgi:threonine aldolase